MYTIKNDDTYELEIKKSKFISKLYRVNNIEDVNNILSSGQTPAQLQALRLETRPENYRGKRRRTGSLRNGQHRDSRG